MASPFSALRKLFRTVKSCVRAKVKSLVQTIQRFRDQHPKAAKWIGIGLIVVGSTIVIYSLAVGILGVVGFGSAGVAKASLAAVIQSVHYGAYTCGIFSAFQSIGATFLALPAVVPVIAAVVTAFGAWFSFYKPDAPAPPFTATCMSA